MRQVGKKESISEIQDRTNLARENLDLSDGGAAKTESLSMNLSDAWESPRVIDYQDSIRVTVTGAATQWQALSDELQFQYDKTPEEDAESSDE